MKKISLLIGICAVLILGSAFTATLVAGRVFLTEPTAKITELEAKKIALQDAGESLSDVTFTRSSLEAAGDRAMYHVEFYSDSMAYQYQIDGDTGTVYHREGQRTEKAETVSQVYASENPDGSGASDENQEDALAYIGVKRAQEIALEDAGLKESQVRYEKANLDEEDGFIVYDIHFQKDGMEYEYTIKAADGTILEKEIEREDEEFRQTAASEQKNASSDKSSVQKSSSAKSSSSGQNKGSAASKSQKQKRYYDDDDHDDDHDDHDDHDDYDD